MKLHICMIVIVVLVRFFNRHHLHQAFLDCTSYNAGPNKKCVSAKAVATALGLSLDSGKSMVHPVISGST